MTEKKHISKKNYYFYRIYSNYYLSLLCLLQKAINKLIEKEHIVMWPSGEVKVCKT
jgi:hypothetical protein